MIFVAFSEYFDLSTDQLLSIYIYRGGRRTENLVVHKSFQGLFIEQVRQNLAVYISQDLRK